MVPQLFISLLFIIFFISPVQKLGKYRFRKLKDRYNNSISNLFPIYLIYLLDTDITFSSILPFTKTRLFPFSLHVVIVHHWQRAAEFPRFPRTETSYRGIAFHLVSRSPPVQRKRAVQTLPPNWLKSERTPIVWTHRNFMQTLRWHFTRAERERERERGIHLSLSCPRIFGR